METIMTRTANVRTPGRAAQGVAERIRQFTPNWFAVTMGNGIVFLALNATGCAGFAALGIVLAALLGGLWLVVLSKTLRELARGHLFHAPCLVPARQVQVS
jgi:hypothetical protein